jgi:polyhydroxybutyrate depolymerase
MTFPDPTRTTAARRSTAWLVVLGVLLTVALAAAVVLVVAKHRRDRNPPAGGVAGTTTHTIVVDGRERSFRLYRPASLPASAPAPLVVMLHGALGSSRQAESTYGWNAKADSEGFLVAYPDGISRSWAVSRECCGRPARDGVDDVAFITQVVATVSGELRVDPARVYAAGISNGGMLAYKLACETTIFAAIAPVSATMLGQCPSPRPTSVIHIHGTADELITYNGGPGDGRVKINGPAVPTVINRWRQVDRCASPAVETNGPLTTAVATCPAERAVELITIAGAGHQWPGAEASPRAAQRGLDLDPPSTALDATQTIWQFFETHPRPSDG